MIVSPNKIFPLITIIILFSMENFVHIDFPELMGYTQKSCRRAIERNRWNKNKGSDFADRAERDIWSRINVDGCEPKQPEKIFV